MEIEMINELEIVALTENIADHGLQIGDIGTIVHKYEEGKAFEVEFVSAEGKTIALLTLTHNSIRKVTGNEMLHVRKLELMVQ